MSNGYPSTSLPLLTQDIAQIIGNLSIPKEIQSRYNLRELTSLADLVGVDSSTLPPNSIKPLGDYIAGCLQNRFSKLYELDGPIYKGYLSFSTLYDYLSARTTNALLNLEMDESSNVSELSLSFLAATPGLGVRGLLETLSVIHTKSVTKIDDVSRDLLKIDNNLNNAALNLSKKVWSTRIFKKDPRFTSLMSNFIVDHMENPSLEDICLSLIDVHMFINEAKSKEYELNRIAIAANSFNSMKLKEEALSIIEAVERAPRNIKILTKRLGADGQDPSTLEMVAQEEKVTRERIRQIEKKCLSHIDARMPIWTPALDKTLKFIDDNQPIPVEQLSDLLFNSQLVNESFSINAILRLAEIFEKHVDFQHHKKSGIISRDSHIKTRADIISLSLSLTTHWGAVQIKQVKEELTSKNILVDEQEIIAAVSSRDDFYWLDKEDGWFWLKTAQKNRVLNYVEKIMSVAGSIEISDLRNGTGRWHRVNGYRLPKRILKALCISTSLYTVKNDTIIGGKNMPDWMDVLTQGEKAIVSVLFENNYAMRRADLEEKVVDLGIPRSSFYIYLGYSPVLERYAPGVYGLRGAPISAAQIEALIPPRQRSGRLFRDDGWTSEGNLWAGYMISKASAASGVVSVPSKISDLVKGNFRLQTSEKNSIGSITVSNSNLWGLSPFFRKWSIEEGDYMVIVFNIKERIAVVYSGDSELISRFQEQKEILIDGSGDIETLDE